MRRTLLAVLISALAMAIVPAAVVARGHDRRHHQRERRHHHRHHQKVRHERLGHVPVSGRDARTAGTIKSFTGQVLTITRNNGSMVSGDVTAATRIRCDAPEPAEMRTDDHGSGRDDRGHDEAGERACTTADLMPGAVVQDAELRVSGSGSVWEEVELASRSR